MRAAVGYFILGLILSCAWILAAHLIGLDEWERAWWAGCICGALNLISTQRLMKALRQ